MPTFTPPTLSDIPAFNADSSRDQVSLYRHFANTTRYVSVYALSDGTFVQDTPNGFAPNGNQVPNTNCNIPLPWDPNNPGAPYATTWFYDFLNNEPSVIATGHDVWIVKLYGFGPQEVTDAEATMLISAGYGDCIE